jgi:hypothetical protein
VLFTTVVLYAGILIALPFNPIYATIFLFTLMAFWSRLPGVGIIDPSYILYLTDFVDLFSLIVAINLGGFYGGLIALFGNIVPRFCGVYPMWYMVIEDAIGQFIVCMVIPLIHVAMGGDIFVSMIIYTILRIILILPVDFFLYPGSKVQWIIEIVVGMVGLFIINGFYAKSFGLFFDGLLAKGVQFSWPLFFFVTAIILIFYITLFGRSKKSTFSIKNTVTGIIKKHKKKKQQDNSAITPDAEFMEIKKIKEMFER